MTTTLERIEQKCADATEQIENMPDVHWAVGICKKCGRRYYIKDSKDGICKYHGYGLSHLPEYMDRTPTPVEISSENRLALGNGSYRCTH
jgi:hypothetical protein